MLNIHMEKGEIMLKAEHRALDNETVYSYLEKLEKAYLLYNNRHIQKAQAKVVCVKFSMKT